MRAMWRFISGLAMVAIIAVGPAKGQANAADETAIRGVIESQLAAFQRDDGPGAYSLASPTIQAKFVNADVFLEMVKTGYPAVYRPREVEFRTLEFKDGRPFQEVFVVGPDGTPVLAIYEMQRQPDGSWRINGCWLVRAPEESV